MKEIIIKKQFRGFTPLEARRASRLPLFLSGPLTGFTLIEALIAVTIITFAVAGPLFTANRAIVSAQGSHLQLVASHLAQEGIEHVRAMRDTEYLTAYEAAPTNGLNPSSVGWDSFTTLIAQCGTACALDPTQPSGIGNGFSLEVCPSGTCSPLYLADGIYQTVGTELEKTPFTRTIQAAPVPLSVTEELITSTVSWSFHGAARSVIIVDHLTPWQ